MKDLQSASKLAKLKTATGTAGGSPKMDGNTPRVYIELYVLLGLDPNQVNISQAEIKRAYRKMATTCHPDKEGGSEEKMAEVNNAYAILGDPDLRAKYDAHGIADRDSTPTEIPGFQFFHEALEAALMPSQKQSQINQILGFGSPPKNSYRDYSNASLVKEVLKNLQAMNTQNNELISEHKEGKRALEKILKRLKFKGKAGSPDVMTGMIKTRLAAHETSLTKLDEQSKDLKAAMGLAKTYDFEVDTPQPPPGRFSQVKGINDVLEGKESGIYTIDVFPDFKEEF